MVEQGSSQVMQTCHQDGYTRHRGCGHHAVVPIGLVLCAVVKKPTTESYSTAVIMESPVRISCKDSKVSTHSKDMHAMWTGLRTSQVRNLSMLAH